MSWFNSLFGQTTNSLGEAVTLLDMVTAAASLASNPSAIDVELDKVRTITSRLGLDQKPSAEDDNTLLDVYIRIEAYLASEDPIRKFDTGELRARLAPTLRQQLEAHERQKGQR